MKSKSSSSSHWIKMGLIWGAIMFVIMALVFPTINQEEITLKSILIGIVIWSLGGLSFGYAMKRINKQDDSNTGI